MRLCICFPIAIWCFAFTIATDAELTRIELYGNSDSNDLKLASVQKAFEGLVDALADSGFPKLAPTTNILSATFGLFSLLLGQKPTVDSPNLKQLIEQFGEINVELDTASQELDQIRNLILESDLKTAYIVEEDAITTGFQKLRDFINGLANIICADAEDCLTKRMQIGETYLPYFDVKQNMNTVYIGATDNSTTFSEPLMEYIQATYGCDVPKVQAFTDGIQRLAFKEQQVTMVYTMLSGSAYSFTDSLGSWVSRMYQLEDFADKLAKQCLRSIKFYMIKDIKDTKYQSIIDSNHDAANALRDDLLEKYPWLDWIVMTFDKGIDTVCKTINIDGEFQYMPAVDVGRRNIIASLLDKGTYETEVKEDISHSLNYILANLDGVNQESTQDVFKHIISEMKERGKWQHIRSFTLVNKAQNWNYAKNDAHYESFFEHIFGTFRLFFILKSQEEMLYLKAYEERTSLVKCNIPCQVVDDTCQQCLNGGVCDHLPYSSDFFCNCKHYFQGERCEKSSNISMATDLEAMFEHTKNIPKLTDIYFEITDLSSYLGTSLGNIRGAIDHLGATIGKAFAQLHETLDKHFKMMGLLTAYGEQIISLQYFIELFDDAEYYQNVNEYHNWGLWDLAMAVLGDYRYNGIRRWLHDFNKLIMGSSEFTLTPEEPLLVTYMEQYKDQACTPEYKGAIDNIWRQLMFLQQRGYIIWMQALHILHERTDSVLEQYEELTNNQIATMEANTCEIDIPGSENIHCSGGYYMNDRIELTVTCQENYYLVGNAIVTCTDAQASCNPCDCSSEGSVSQECDDQTGRCSCRENYFGDRCQNRNCIWSDWEVWSACQSCGYGTQTRNREVTEPAMGEGTCQGEPSQSRPCFEACCENEFHCDMSERCILESQVCDNIQDCNHNDDESGCCEIMYTPWRYNDGGDTASLAHHHIDCGDDQMMITKFKLEYDSSQDEIRYMFVCCRFSHQFCNLRAVTNARTERNGALIYLDKQHVDCGNNNVLKSFHLTVPDADCWYYQYQCCDVYPTYQRTCDEKYSDWTEDFDLQNFHLSNQDFQCETGSYLSYFRLERNYPLHDHIRYKYTCCSVF